MLIWKNKAKKHRVNMCFLNIKFFLKPKKIYTTMLSIVYIFWRIRINGCLFFSHFHRSVFSSFSKDSKGSFSYDIWLSLSSV